MVSNMNIVVFTYFKKGNLKPLAFVFFSYSLAEHWAQGTYDKILCQQLGKFEWFFLVFRFRTSASTHGINILFACLTIVQTFLWLYKKLNFLEDRHNQRAPTLNSHWHQVELERILMTEKKYHENSINDKSNNNNSSFHCDKV